MPLSAFRSLPTHRLRVARSMRTPSCPSKIMRNGRRGKLLGARCFIAHPSALLAAPPMQKTSDTNSRSRPEPAEERKGAAFPQVVDPPGFGDARDPFREGSFRAVFGSAATKNARRRIAAWLGSRSPHTAHRKHHGNVASIQRIPLWPRSRGPTVSSDPTKTRLKTRRARSYLVCSEPKSTSG